MMRHLRAPGVLLTLALLAACQSPQPVSERGLSAEQVPEDLAERYVHQIVGSLRDSFVAKDTAGFMKHVSEGFYRGRERLRQNLEMEFRKGTGPFLEAAVVEVADEDLRAVVTVRWQRSPAPGAEAMVRGETLLVFHKGDSLSLVDFRNGSLFGIGGF